MDVTTLAAYISVAVAVSGVLSALAGHWVARRASSGRVATSDAAVLWAQAQDMRAMLLAEKDKAEEQRDRLIEAYTQQTFPVLTEVNTAVMSLSAAVAEDVRLAREILALVKGGGHALSVAVQDTDAGAGAS